MGDFSDNILHGESVQSNNGKISKIVCGLAGNFYVVEKEGDETVIVGESFVNKSEEGEIWTQSGKLPGPDGSFTIGNAVFCKEKF